MTMPGFTADAAIDGFGTPYGMTGTADAPAKGGVVVPQACVNLGPCRVCVDFRPFPPRACLRFSCLGFNRSICVP